MTRPYATLSNSISRMKAVIVDANTKDSAKSLSIGDIEPVRLSKDNDVLVQIKAFGLNRMDIMQRKGLVRLSPLRTSRSGAFLLI